MCVVAISTQILRSRAVRNSGARPTQEQVRQCQKAEGWNEGRGLNQPGSVVDLEVGRGGGLAQDIASNARVQTRVGCFHILDLMNVGVA